MRRSSGIGSALYLWSAITVGVFLNPVNGSASNRDSGAATIPTPATETSPPQSTTPQLFIGLAEVPPESEGTSLQAQEKWYGIAAAAGINMQQITPKWSDMESPTGAFDFQEFDLKSHMAKKYGLPVYLNLRIIDTVTRSMPKQYAEWKFDDPRMTERLSVILQALQSRNQADIRWIAIGNEVDPYFMKHLDEVNAYHQLLINIFPVVKKLFPGATVTVNFTFEALSHLNKELKPLFDIGEIFSVTYYPLNPDFTVRQPDVIKSDFKLIMAAASTKRVMFQEVGYPSAELLGSSPDKQALFLDMFFDQLRKSQPQAIGMTYLFMSDLPKSLVDSFGDYYNQPGSDKFKAFLATLGLFDGAAKPKPGWSVFERNAKAK